MTTSELNRRSIPARCSVFMGHGTRFILHASLLTSSLKVIAVSAMASKIGRQLSGMKAEGYRINSPG